MGAIFLEVWFEGDSLDEKQCNLDDIEDVLGEVLFNSKLGEVTGSGSGILGANIDVEIFDESSFDKALILICETLRKIEVPTNALITRYKPSEHIYKVYPKTPN